MRVYVYPGVVLQHVCVCICVCVGVSWLGVQLVLVMLRQTVSGWVYFWVSDSVNGRRCIGKEGSEIQANPGQCPSVIPLSATFSLCCSFCLFMSICSSPLSRLVLSVM